MDAFLPMMEHYVTVAGPPTVTAGGASDTGGGTQVTWPTNRATGIQCLINAPMGISQDRFGQPMLIGTATIAMFYTGAQRGDRIEVTAGPTYVGLKMRVIGIKSQPRVEFLGFTEDINHLQCENVS